MKKLFMNWKILSLMLIMSIIMSGCTKSDLTAYQKAFMETESYESGEVKVRLETQMTFNEEGLSFEEQRDLSYYENLIFDMESKFDNNEDQSLFQAKTYYNFGGMGLDMTLYSNGEEVLMQMPIMDKYIRMDMDKYIEEYGDSNFQNFDTEVFEALSDKWLEILQSEDVLVGEKEYIMTDKGQIKTTTYDVKINEEQFNELKQVLVDEITDNDLLVSMIENSTETFDMGISPDEMQASIIEVIDRLKMKSFDSTAYVDFDGRLVKEEIGIEIYNDSSEIGEMSTMQIQFTIEYDKLGKQQDIVFPQISEEDIIEADDAEKIRTTIEGLF